MIATPPAVSGSTVMDALLYSLKDRLTEAQLREVVAAVMVVQSEELRPVMIGIQYFFQLNFSWGEVMAYASLITVPVVVLFIAFQRSFVNSIASSGVKG